MKKSLGIRDYDKVVAIIKAQVRGEVTEELRDSFLNNMFKVSFHWASFFYGVLSLAAAASVVLLVLKYI